MIHPSQFLRRALLADAVFSGIAAMVLTLDAGALAPLLALPEALLRETGLFLIAYTGGGRLARHSPNHAENPGLDRDRRKYRMDRRQHRAVVLGRGDPEPARRSLCRGPGDRNRRLRRAAIYRPAPKRRRGRCG